MNGRHNPKKDLELEIKNFGPIAKANVDIRPLTVFIGPSNTGKSYLAILIYALHGFFNGQRRYNLQYGSSPIIVGHFRLWKIIFTKSQGYRT